MKTKCLLALITIAFISASTESFAADFVQGVLVPVSEEKIGILTGDKAMITVGEREGIVKGDIASVLTDPRDDNSVIGECAVTKNGYQASVCEIIKAKREIEKGNSVRFPVVTYRDPTLFALSVAVLSSVVDPYEPYKNLRVCLYPIFNEQNAETALSDEMGRELEGLLSQKKRIQLVDRQLMRNLVFLPDGDKAMLNNVKDYMKKTNIDVLVTGRYTVSSDKVEMIVNKIDQNGHDRIVLYSFPLNQRYADLSSKVTISAQDPTKIQNSPCTISLKKLAHQPRKEERNNLIILESRENPFTEQTLRRIEFNILNPVSISVKVDDEVMPFDGKDTQVVTLSQGIHRIAVSFKRGYFLNETLLYTSNNELTKEVMLDLRREKHIAVDVRLSPLFEKEPIAFNVYERVHRQKQVLKPIYRVESDKLIETFKD